MIDRANIRARRYNFKAINTPWWKLYALLIWLGRADVARYGLGPKQLRGKGLRALADIAMHNGK